MPSPMKLVLGVARTPLEVEVWLLSRPCPRCKRGSLATCDGTFGRGVPPAHWEVTASCSSCRQQVVLLFERGVGWPSSITPYGYEVHNRVWSWTAWMAPMTNAPSAILDAADLWALRDRLFEQFQRQEAIAARGNDTDRRLAAHEALRVLCIAREIDTLVSSDERPDDQDSIIARVKAWVDRFELDTPRPGHGPTPDHQVPDTPPPFGYKTSWLAVRTSDPTPTRAIASTLRMGLRAADDPLFTACNWSSALANRWPFISPCIASWVFVLESGVEADVADVAVRRLSAALDTEVCHLASDRVVGHFAWSRAARGQLVRSVWVEDGRVLRDVGARGDGEPDPLLAGEDAVLEMAGLWSIDPTRFPTSEPALGWRVG